MTHLLLSALLVAAALPSPGESTKCYMCSSLEDPKCADPMKDGNGLQAVDCSSATLIKIADVYNTAHRKISELGSSFGFDTKSSSSSAASGKFSCTKVDTGDKERIITTRGCTPQVTTTNDICVKIRESQPKEMVVSFCGVCDTDLCNSARGLSNSLALLFILPIALIFASR